MLICSNLNVYEINLQIILLKTETVINNGNISNCCIVMLHFSVIYCKT